MFLVYIQMGVVFALIGLIIPTLANKEPSNWVGIRTPLTMGNREAWKLVHQRGWLPFIIAAALSFLGLWGGSYMGIERDMVLNLGLIFGIVIYLLIHLLLIVRQVGQELQVGAENVDRSRYNQAMEKQQKGVKIAGIFIGIVFIITGLVSPMIGDIGPNPTTGIRTERSMSSPEAWKEVHDAAVLPLIVCGVAIIIASWLVPMMKVKPGMRMLIWFAIIALAIAILMMVI